MRPVSDFWRFVAADRFEPLPQVMKNVRYKKGKPLEEASVKSAIVSGERRLNGQGRLVIRPSGTEPVIRVMVEGEDAAKVRAHAEAIADAVRHAAQPVAG